MKGVVPRMGTCLPGWVLGEAARGSVLVGWWPLGHYHTHSRKVTGQSPPSVVSLLDKDLCCHATCAG